MTTFETIAPRDAGPRAARAPIGTGLARRLVLGRLAALDSGAIELRDDAGTRKLGRPAPDGLAGRIEVVDPRFWRRVALGGSVGAAESWIRGEWRSDDLVALLRVLCRGIEAADAIERGPARLASALARLAHRRRRNTRRGSRRNILAHYDLGNAFFELVLDETMTYSCGIFPREDATLREASIEKIDRICRKLDLGPGMRVLEIGSGWGAFAMHAAERYGCRVTTTTISPAQHRLAADRIEQAGLGDRIELRLQDYRELRGTFDRLVSIEMIEAVGHERLPEYFRIGAERLAPGGLACIQAITMPDHRYARYLREPDFIRTHVFPGSNVPSIGAMTAAIGRASDLRLVHLEEFAAQYARTLAAWRERFRGNFDRVRALGFDDAFVRLWEYYLAYCEAGFRERAIGTVQMVLARPGGAARAVERVAAEPFGAGGLRA